MSTSSASDYQPGDRRKADQRLPVPVEPAPQVSIKVLRTAEEIEGLRGYWSAWPGSRDSDIDGVLTECRTSPDVLAPHVIVVYRDGVPAALLAGRIVRRRFEFQIGYLSPFKPLANAIMIPYGGFRGDCSKASSEQVVGQVIRSLKNHDADLAVFDHLDVDSAIFRSVRKMPTFLLRDHLPSVQLHWVMKLPDSVEGLYASLSYNQRQHFRKTARKLRRTFPEAVRFRRLNSPSDLDTMIGDIEQIAKTTYQRKLGVGFNTSAPLVDYLRMEAERGSSAYTSCICLINRAHFGLARFTSRRFTATILALIRITLSMHQGRAC